MITANYTITGKADNGKVEKVVSGKQGSREITFGSLFAGIGGIDLGLERAGMKCVWQVEIDDYCNRVLAKHWPDVARYRDVREVGKHNLAPVDLICGGFPCQDVSLAGKRAGLEGKRTTLWTEYARIIGELRPRWVLAENVPGLLSSDNGRFFGNVLRDLAAIGYDAEWDCVPAAAVGAPHKRDRVFIVAYPASGSRPPTEQALSIGGCESRLVFGRGGSGCGERDAATDVADANGAGCQEQRGAEPVGAQQRPVECGGAEMADAGREGRECRGTGGGDASARKVFDLRPTDGGTPLADAASEYGERAVASGDRRGEPEGAAGDGSGPWTDLAEQWATEPAVCELADGVPNGLVRYAGRVARNIPNRVAKLRCLGNAVVPQVAELIGRMIVAAD